MANGFGSLYVGSSGLQSAQNALNTTANNLMNVNTTGYVRQQVLHTDRHYNTVDTSAAISYQQSGLGVKIGDVIHARDIFLDKASMVNLSPIEIVHGHGTGQLRTAIRDYLSDSPYVAKYRQGEDSEGGNGVTIVDIN